MHLLPWWGWEKRFSKSLDQFPLDRVCVKISEQCRIAPSVVGEKGWQGGGEHHPWLSVPSGTSSSMLAPQAVGMPTAGMVLSTKDEVVVPACASSEYSPPPHCQQLQDIRAAVPKSCCWGEHMWGSRAQGGLSELVGDWAE